MTRSTRDALTEFFMEVVADVSDELGRTKVDDEAMWALARRLHSTWRRAVEAADAEVAPEKDTRRHGHVAMEELLRLVNIEVCE